MFANNALRRNTSTYYDSIPKDVNMLFILAGLDIVEFCCCCCCFVIVSFLHVVSFLHFLEPKCAVISLSVICAIQFMSATRAGTCTSESENVNGEQLDVTAKTNTERVQGTWEEFQNSLKSAKASLTG